jgi:hypothetical protein
MNPYLLLVVLVLFICIVIRLCTKRNKSSRDENEKFANMKPLQNGLDPKFYSNNLICSTPSNFNCITNDSCAQYGLGEVCVGPIGEMKCVCNSKSSDNAPMSTNNVLIGPGAVCSEDKQCETGFCVTDPGLFSKLCGCPDNYTLEGKKCVKLPEKVIKNEVNNFFLGGNIQGVPGKDTSSACSTTGKFCKTSSDCSLGEGCNSNGLCICLLNYTNDVDPNRIKVGGKCESSEQCIVTSDCVNSECTCPAGTYYDFTNNKCNCDDPELTYDKKLGCVRASQIPRTICPSNKNTFCDSNQKCGTGEYCDPVTRRCICNANTFSGVINAGGKCETNEQCDSGVCTDMNGKLDYKVCKYSPVNIFDLVSKKFSF